MKSGKSEPRYRRLMARRGVLGWQQHGAAIAELVVVLPALLMLGLGVLESALFYQAKTTVTYATFEAARKGATTHAQKRPMRDEFGMRIASIYGGDGSGAKAQAAMAEGQIDAHNPLITTIDIINPNSEAFLEFGVENPKTGQIEIPNTHLRYRDPNVVGAKSEVNVQDANLLKIQAEYGYQLRVPLVAQALTGIMKQFDPGNARYYDQGRIPISAVATVRMQSAAWENGNLNADGTVPNGGSVANGVAGDPDQRGGDPTPGPNDLDGDGIPNSSDPDIDGDGIANADDPDADGDGEPDADEQDPNEVECETTWDDERYQSVECDRWYCKLQEFTSELKAAANVIWDFLEGFVAGIGDQISDLWELAKDPTVLLDIAKAFIDDPKGTLEAIVESISEDVEKVLQCGPKDIGRIAGQNVNPATPLRVLSKLADVSKNARLSAYVRKKEVDLPCASFPSDTLIWTNSGLIPISKIKEGTVVVSRDERSMRDSPQLVSEVYYRESSGIYEIDTEFGKIYATGEHPFWVQGEGWIAARDLAEEHPIATVNGDVLVFEVKYIQRPTTVYNFSVANTPNYFASQIGVWVHNAGPCSSKLGDNIGPKPFPDISYENHHLIPGKFLKDYEVLQDLDELGLYDINRATNGIHLPNSTRDAWLHYVRTGEKLPVHKGRHGNDAYFNVVEDSLDAIDAEYRRILRTDQAAAQAYAERALGGLEQKVRTDLKDLDNSLNTSNKHRPWQDDRVSDEVDRIRRELNSGAISDDEAVRQLEDLYSQNGGRVTN